MFSGKLPAFFLERVSCSFFTRVSEHVRPRARMLLRGSSKPGRCVCRGRTLLTGRGSQNGSSGRIGTRSYARNTLCLHLEAQLSRQRTLGLSVSTRRFCLPYFTLRCKTVSPGGLRSLRKKYYFCNECAPCLHGLTSPSTKRC